MPERFGTEPAATLAASEFDDPYLQGRAVLVTGATGFIGRRLVRRLISAGACVRALVRLTSNLQVLRDVRDRLEIRQGDLEDANSLKASVRGTEIVIHLANAVGRTWKETRRATVGGTECLLESARAAGVERFLYVSSMAVYDYGSMPPGAVVDENAPLEADPRIRNDYARSKCEAEEVVRRYLRASEMAVTIVRPGAVYGPHGAPHIPTTIRVVADRVAFAIGGGQRPIPLVYVDDLVDALLRIACSPVAAGKIYNIVDDAPISERVYALKYLGTQGRRVMLVPLPRMPFLWAASLYDWTLRLSRRKKDSAVLRSLRRVTNPVCFSAAAVANDLGWRARTKLDDGIRASINEVPAQLVSRNGGGQRLQCAIVGCGYISDVYMEAFRGLPEVRVAAACDMDAERLAAFCAKYRIDRGFTDAGKLLECDELSFVVIATPPSTHHALCRAALGRGVPVLVEKPVCLSLGEAQELAERSARTGVPVAVMQNYRFKDAVLKARRLHQSGELGELRRVDCIYHGGNPGNHKENWRRQERQNRLLLYEWAEHFLDIEIAFAGPVKKILDVRAATHPGKDSTLEVNALVEHVTGVTGSVDLQLFSGAESVRVELHGSRGRVVVKFYPEGCAAYRGLITPLHELLEESKRTAQFAWGVAYEKLSPARVSRRALSHWRFLRHYVDFLQGRENCLPLSIEEILPTAEFLDQLAAAVY